MNILDVEIAIRQTAQAIQESELNALLDNYAHYDEQAARDKAYSVGWFACLGRVKNALSGGKCDLAWETLWYEKPL